MSEKYTPTTGQVEDCFILGALHAVGNSDELDRDEAIAKFYRWLLAEKANAWEKGAESAFYNPEIRGFVDYPDNPYRKESQ